ncbi:MAG TPA: M1 family metallopeptidase [Dehalococcoidia bacterium]|nr:M1 family metallopeptidase [Dehalococcoidia bacterium]
MTMLVRRVVLAALLLTLLGQGMMGPRPSLAASPPLYSVEASVEYGAGLVTARETVAFTNLSSQTLESLVFNVTPAYYGAFELRRAAVNALEVEQMLDGSILELPLPHPLPPGASVVASLDFKIVVPRQGGRFGRGPQVMALGNWLPLLAVYRDGRLLSEGQERGWVRGQYVDVGDAFFSQTADFLVTLRSDQPLSVAHTGDLVKQEDTVWAFEARGVRDFALALSPDFSVVSQEVEGVDVAVFYLPGHEAIASTYLRAAVETLAWMKQKLIPYPYRHLHLAEINAINSGTVGQEYPSLILASDGMAATYGGLDSSGGILAIHETAHQWYYGIIGNDQLYEPWVDEALVTWLSYHLLRAKGLGSFAGIWQDRVANPRPPSLPVNSSIYDYPSDGPYFSVVYRRGALFLEELYQSMGEEPFFAALKEYSASFSGRVANPYALLDAMQAHTSTNLNHLIRRYFSYPRYQADEPLRVSARYPLQDWSEAVRITLESDVPLQEVQVFVDDSLYSRALPAHVFLETAQLEEGPHLLTLRVSDGQREVDLTGTFSVVRRPPPPPPAALPTPAPTLEAALETPDEEIVGNPTEADDPAAQASVVRTAAGIALVTISIAALAASLVRHI